MDWVVLIIQIITIIAVIYMGYQLYTLQQQTSEIQTNIGQKLGQITSIFK